MEKEGLWLIFFHRIERSLLTLKNKKKNPKEMFLVALKQADENRATHNTWSSSRAGQGG